MSTTEARIKELVRQFNEEVWDNGNLDVIEEYVAAKYVGHNPTAPEPTKGPDGAREFVRAARAAFPALDVTTEDLIAEGNRVCRRTRFTGTHEGEFMGIAPTGNTVDVPGVLIYRIEDGRIVESWGQNDLMGMMEQLGVAGEVEPS